MAGHLLGITEAYRQLATCRPEYGAPIPWTAIHQWAEAKQVEERERFEHLIRAMDSEHLTAVERRMKERTSNTGRHG